MAKSIAALGATTALMVAGLAFVAVSPASAAVANTTGVATAITNTTATLNGSVTTDGTVGGATAIYFCWATVATNIATCGAGTNSVDATPFTLAASSTHAESLAMTGLTPHTTYFFNLSGTDSSGPTYGTYTSFTTTGTAGTVTMTGVSPGVSSSVYGTTETAYRHGECK